jgi:DNA topoisomerase-1
LLTQLVHNGIIIAPGPPRHYLTLEVRGIEVALTAKQEEMALAWARKQGTPYVEDPIFVRNFMTDLSAELEVDPPLKASEVDFTPAVRIVEAEREAKASLSSEERKAAAAERKVQREALKEKFGHAIVNGERVELANYMTEPSGIFMGRGKHPLRGRWKEGAHEEDVTLNLSPDAPLPEGNWGEIVWQPDCIWVARWEDKLSGKLKYIWLSDTAPIKQEREAQKFDQALELAESLDRVRGGILEDLGSTDDTRMMLATACYLIDKLCLRVGDEKEPDEADTVGATTLRPEHVTLNGDTSAEFKFLGKDSVLWHRTVELEPAVIENLGYLIENARPSGGGNGSDRPQIFPDIGSREVSEYLSEFLPGLSAKVFRTLHATRAVAQSLLESEVTADDPDFKKHEAAVLANMEAAKLCNHTKKAPANWSDRKERMKERRGRAQERVDKYRDQVKEHREALSALREEAREAEEAAIEARQAAVRKRYRKRMATARRRIETARDRLARAREALGKVDSRNMLVTRTRTLNLGTSLRSYIDPRVYCRWGLEVDYDILDRFYPKALQRKFAWAAEVVQQERQAAEPTILDTLEAVPEG